MIIDTPRDYTLEELSNIYSDLEHRGEWAHGGDIRATVDEWTATRFTVAAVSAYLDAKCFDAGSALELHDAGITATTAAELMTSTVDSYTETIGYLVSNGDMTVQDVVNFLKKSTPKV